jgi:hypothetical protein
MPDGENARPKVLGGKQWNSVAPVTPAFCRRFMSKISNYAYGYVRYGALAEPSQEFSHGATAAKFALKITLRAMRV